MNGNEIFTKALGLQEPWHVVKAEFVDASKNSKELHLWLDFTPGYKFSVNGSTPTTAYDTLERVWRHLNFFEHCCYLHARVPRVKVGEHEIKQVEVPWARPNSGFTMLFEAYAMLLIEDEMPVNGVSEVVKETAPRIWRIFNYWVKKAVDKIDLSVVKRIGVDETSKRKGHDYITQFVDLDRRRTIFVAEGRDKETFKSFKKELEAKGGQTENITAVSMDMSPSFISGALENFPDAGIIFDKFHIFKALNEAIDKVRKLEHADTALLKGHKFTLLFNSTNLSPKKKMELDTLLLTYPTIGKACGFRESFRDIYEDVFNNPDPARRLEEEWCPLVEASGIKPMQDFVKMIKAHMFGIRTFFKNRAVNNGILEGLNSKIQLAKKRARGFCNVENFINVIYFTCGKLQMDYPQYSL